MEISHWHLYVVVNCGLIIPILVAKPFSLNKAINEGSFRKQELTTVSPIFDINTERTAERFSLNNALSTNTSKTKGQHLLGTIKKRNKKLAPLKNKIPIHFKTSLKRNKLKFQERLNLLHKRQNQSKKRNIYSNGKIDKKYFPLLRNLGMLFDNILQSESRESSETNPHTIVKNKQSGKGDDVVCSCTSKSEYRVAKPKSSEKTAVSKPRPKVTTETTVKTETPTTTPYPTSTIYLGSFRPDKIISLLPTRNTTGIRRNHNGLGERSRAALFASVERDIPRHHGNSEHDTRVGENRSSSTNNEKDTDSVARDDSSSDGPQRGIHGNRRNTGRTVHGGETKENESTEAYNSIGHHRGNLVESKRQNKHEIRGNKAKNRKSIPELGEALPTDEVIENKFVQSKEDCEENVISYSKHSTSCEQLAVGDGPVTNKDQKSGPTNEAVITIKDLSNPMLMLQSGPKNLSPQVTIIDGYSVARDKNGQNKLSEKTIRYQSKA